MLTDQLKKTAGICQTAFRSLVQHKLRSGLSILGIVCGTMSVLAMISIGEGARQKTAAQIEQLGIRNIYIKALSLTEDQKWKSGEQRSPGLNTQDAEQIKTGCPYIADTACLKEISASVTGHGSDISPQIAAVSPAYASVLSLSLYQGRFIADQDIQNKNSVCVLGGGIAEKTGIKAIIGDCLRIENHLFTIIGILKQTARNTEENSAISVRNCNEMVFIPLNTRDREKDLTEIIVQTEHADRVVLSGKMVERIMEVAHHQANDYQMLIPLELLQQAQKTRRTFSIVLSAIASISLLVGGIGIMNIMLATVSERTKEIGIRRAVGAAKSDIVFQFLTESVILTSLGGSAGIVLGAAAAWFLSVFAGWDTVITLFSVFLPLLMSVLAGIFFGLYPAWQAACMDPAAALRHE